MVVEFKKLHSNYLQPNTCGMESGRRINKPYPIENSGIVTLNNDNMCFVNNNFKKTILTNKSDGLLSFKGHLSLKSVSKIYDYMRWKVNPNLFIKNSEKFERTKKAIERLCARAEKKHPVLVKIISNETFQKAMKFMNDNQLLSDAGIALLYTCMLRPLSIAALPAKDKNEKEKNHYQIGHSISTGIIGFITAFVLQTPIKHAIEKVTTAVSSKNAQKYIDDSSKYLFSKENIEKTRMLMERAHQPISLPLKAALTIFLVPKILKVFGLSKKPKCDNNKDGAIPYDAFKYFASFKRKSSSFQNFSGGLMDGNQ